METISVISTNVDGYEAGIELAEKLKTISPEIIFIFPTVNYNNFTDLLDGMYDELEDDNIIIFGGTGDGFYSADIVGTYGVSALGINSQGKINWTLEVEEGISNNSYNAAKTCAEKIMKKIGKKPKTAIVLSDGIVGDGDNIVKGVRDVFDIPFAGGTTGDDRKFKNGYIITNRKVTNNSVAILAMDGKFDFAMSSRSGWLPIGKLSKVNKANGNIVQEIEGQKAMHFLKDQLNITSDVLDLAMFPIAVFDDHNNFVLRAPIKWDEDTGEIFSAGSIKEGSMVRMSHATINDVLKGVNEVVEDISNIDFTPKAALVFSCTARKWLLGSKIENERIRLFETMKMQFPIAGFPTFGEIGAIRNKDNNKYSPTYFHNETYVIFIFG